MLIRIRVHSKENSGVTVSPYERHLYFWNRLRDRLLFRFSLRRRRTLALKRLTES